MPNRKPEHPLMAILGAGQIRSKARQHPLLPQHPVQAKRIRRFLPRFGTEKDLAALMASVQRIKIG